MESRDVRKAPTSEQTWYELWMPRLAIGILVALTFWFGGQWAFTSISGFLLTLLMSFFVAFAMLPAVQFLSRRGWRRGAAAGAVMAGGAAIAGLFVFAIANVFIGQVANLFSALPAIVTDVQIWVDNSFGVTLNLEELGLEVSDVAGYVAGVGSGLLGVVSGVTGSVLGLVFQALTVGLFVFYILADWPRLRATILRTLPQNQQEIADTATGIVIDKVGGWVYSRGALAAVSAVFHFVLFLVIDLPYPFALALWVGVISQFIPTIGRMVFSLKSSVGS